jgi:hypothetical protein
LIPASALLLIIIPVVSYITLSTEAAMKINIQTIPYKGWKNNLKLSNGAVELVITLDIGPRIISYSYAGGRNVFKEFDEQIGKSGEKEWMIRGGHRLWHAPEDAVRTYATDNGPVKWEKLGESSVRLVQPVESMTGIQKEMDVRMDDQGTGVTVTHRLRNTSLWDVELAPWALSVMAPGGAAIIPLPEKIAHPGSLEPGEKPDYRGFVANQNLILWPFTDLADPRFRWGTSYITLTHDSAAKKPVKLGVAHKTGWIGYLNNGLMFIKGFEYRPGAHYTDGGSNFETFTNKDFLEVETLGPLQRIAPGAAIEHVEKWWLLKDLPNETTDKAIDSNIRLKVESLLKGK